MLWFCLHFPSLPLEVFTRLDDNAEQQAVLIAEHHRVLCANPKAAQLGVVTGQSVATANALCNRVHTLERNPGQERKALAQLAQRCYQFTPMVSLQPPASVLLEISGSLVLFKGLAQLQKQLLQELGELGYSIRNGSGQTPGAAWLAARAGLGAETPGEPRRQLKQLPLAYLDISDKQRTQLQDMGFSRLGELFALPPHAVGRRFGQDFLHYLQQLTGERPDPRQPIELDDAFSSELFYIDGLENIQALLFPAKRLLAELGHYLRYRQLHCRSFNWHFEQLGKQRHRLTMHLSRPQNNTANFLELTRIRLERLALDGAVHSITLSSNDFAAASAANQSLLKLDADHQQQVASPERLLDKLGARLGQTKLFGIAPVDEHVPELAWRATTTPALGQRYQQPADKNANRYAAGEHHHTRPRPSWLLRHPAPLQQRNRDLYWQGKRITLLRGPERIDSHWWQSSAVRRDYFVARREDGGLYWIYREVTSPC